MRTIYSQQYRKPCVVASPTDAADAVLAACRAGGAHVLHGNSQIGYDDEELVVQLRDDVGPELWTEAALRRSLRKGAGS